MDFIKNIDKRILIGIALIGVGVGGFLTYRYIRFKANASKSIVL